MTKYLVDVIFVAGILLIMITSLMKNQKVMFRNVFNFGLSTVLVVVGTVLDPLGLPSKVINKVASFNLGRYFSYLPAAFETEEFKTLVGLGVFFVAILVVYIVLTLLCKLFSGKRRKMRKDPTYTTIHRPFVGFLVGIVKSALFVYVFAMFLSVGKGCFPELNVDGSFIYSHLEAWNLIVFDGTMKDKAALLFN